MEKLLKTNGALFCIHCGQIELTLVELMNHMTVRHRTSCDQCQGSFVDEVQLAAHKTIHHTFEVEERLKNCVPTNVVQLAIGDARPVQHSRSEMFTTKRYPLKKILAHEYLSEQSNVERGNASYETDKKQENCENESGETCDVFSDDSINSDDIQSFLASKKETSSNLDDFDATVDDDSLASSYSVETELGNSSIDMGKVNAYSGTSAESFSCNMCGIQFQNKKDLVKHTMVYHSDNNLISDAAPRVRLREGTYECEVCKRTFRYRKSFMRHKSCHEGEQSTCDKCGKQFSHHRYVINHIKRVHLKIKNYPCDICGRRFTDTKTRSDHRRTHTGEKPFICEICGKAFPTHTCIYVHRRSHTDNFPHECVTCNKRYRTRQGLQIHIRTHTGEMPYPCDLCDKRFKDKNQLHRHRQIHSTDKPHVCFLCGIGFTVKRYLKRHMMKHAELVQTSVYNGLCNQQQS